VVAALVARHKRAMDKDGTALFQVAEVLDLVWTEPDAPVPHLLEVIPAGIDARTRHSALVQVGLAVGKHMARGTFDIDGAHYKITKRRDTHRNANAYELARVGAAPAPVPAPGAARVIEEWQDFGDLDPDVIEEWQDFPDPDPDDFWDYGAADQAV
jgi:hypothetical protein